MRRTLLFILAFLPMLASADAIEIDGIYYSLDSEAKTGALSIWMWDRRITIMKLSSNRMTMRTRQIVTDEETMDEYERLSDPIEIEDKIDE